MKAQVALLAVPVFLALACSTSSSDPSEKMTASLSRALKASAADTAAAHHVIGIPSRAITGEMENDVRKLGVSAFVHTDHLLKTRATSSQVAALASLDWMERLDLDPEHKFDVSLRMRIEQMKRSNSRERLDVIGRCSAAIPESGRRELEESGAKIRTVIGDIFTAETDLRSLYKLAGLDAVTAIQLAGESSIK